MGTASGAEEAVRLIAGTFAGIRAPGSGEWFRADQDMPFNVSAWGHTGGTLQIERSFDGGTTWLPLSRDALGTAATFSGPFSVSVVEPEAGVLFRLNCTAAPATGTASYRISA